MIAAALFVLVLFDMPEPPPCKRLGTVDVSGLTLEATAVEAQMKAEKKGATHLWVKKKTEPGACGGYYRIKGVALKCEQPKVDE